MMRYHAYLDDQCILSPVSGSLSAAYTNMDMATGVYSWCIAIPISLSAHPTLLVQANYSNYYLKGQSPVSPIRFGMTTPLPANHPHEVENLSFSSNWITIDSITTGQTYFHTTKPVRFIRLAGTVSADGIHGATLANFGNTAFYAYVWSTGHVLGQ
jgi:hypothetical protein